MRLSLLDVVVTAMIVGIVIAMSRPIGDHDYAHRFPPPPPNAGDGFADVAGEYRQGALGRFWTLKILPDGGYSFLWSGCQGVYHRESGAASRAGEDLVLSPLKPIGPPMERTFLPIRWGRRSYLIPTGEIQKFCDAIVRGDEPRFEIRGRFYLLGDEAPVSGVPELPEEWAAYLRENLVIGAITDVTATGRARADVGSEDGVRVGSILTARRREGLVDSSEREFRTVLVNTNSCEIEPLYPEPRKRPIEPGWELIAKREPPASTGP
jgi:hypothetical protein